MKTHMRRVINSLKPFSRLSKLRHSSLDFWNMKRLKKVKTSINISKKNLGNIKKCIEMLIRSLRKSRENQENLDRNMYINKSKQVDKSTACFGPVKNTLLEEATKGFL